MVVDATNSIIPYGTFTWYVNNTATNKLTTLSGTITLNEGDTIKLEVVGNSNTHFYQYTIPTLVCNVSYDNLTRILSFDFTGSIFPNNAANSFDYINIFLTLYQNSTTLNLTNGFQIIQFNSNPVFQWDLTGESYSNTQNFDIEFYVVEHHKKLNAPGMADVASPTVITQTITPGAAIE